LLRFQSQHQPDLFTSNPSLIHHLNPHGIVAQGAAHTAAGSGGAAGGAGRAYGGASGGYTGHARAFLSVPGSGGDIAGVNTSAEEREKRKARQSAGLALRRGAKVPEPTLPRTVMMKDRMASRSGSRPVAMVEMKEDADDRKAITYPAWTGLPPDAGPGGALWAPNSAPRPIGARAFSTSVQRTEGDEIPVPLISAAGPQRIEQPNHVLQDLAGLDLGRPGRVGQRRRNSTASVVRSETEDADVAAPAEPDADANIYHAIVQRGAAEPEFVSRLIHYYRRPRDADSISFDKDPKLTEDFPLPAGYTVMTYNAIIQFLLLRRTRGASIAPILSTYNEMLTRDVVPNIRTTSLVIRALCLREEDVSAASRRWFHVMEAQKLNEQLLGIPAAKDDDAAKIIEGYQHEQNLASAVNLFRIASSFYKGPKSRETETAALEVMLGAAATSIGLPHAPGTETIQYLLDALNNSKQLLPLPSVASAFQLLADMKDPVGTAKLWERVLAEYPDLFINRAYKTAALSAQNEAIRAFVATGDKAKATEIVNVDGYGKATRSLALASSLAKAGEVDEAAKLLGEYATDNNKSFHTTYDVAEALLAAGRFTEGVKTVTDLRRSTMVNQPGRDVDTRRMRNIYARVLGATLKNPEDAELVSALADAAANCNPRVEPPLLAKHIEILINTGRYDDISPLLLATPSSKTQTAQATEEDVAALREAFAAVVTSEASISVVLQAIRGFARLDQSIAHPYDSIPLPTAVVDKYVASRARVQNVGELGIQLDGWYRLLEVFDAVPTSHIDAGAIDAALETFMADLAEAQKAGGLKLPNTIFTSSYVKELVGILTARFGTEHASELVTKAFGERASHLLPTPEQTPAASESEFTLPPTPESAQSPPASFQPSEHTLSISPKLAGLIDRLHTSMPPATPVEVYNTVREAIARENTVPSPDAIGRLITQLARAGEEAKARELYQLAQVVLASCVPDPQQQAEAWRSVEDNMIAACCFLGQLEQAGMHRARIIEAGMAPSADAYATMIASSRDSTDDALVARELFDESQSLGVVPHLYLFNTIISKLSKARKAEMALDLFQHMKSAGIRPSSVTYGAVINACCRVGDAESAETLFDEMVKQPNFKPRVPPFK
jgi:pentatricopeptide repeat protein